MRLVYKYMEGPEVAYSVIDYFGTVMKSMMSEPLPLLWSGHEISCYYGRDNIWAKGGTDLILGMAE